MWRDMGERSVPCTKSVMRSAVSATCGCPCGPPRPQLIQPPKLYTSQLQLVRRVSSSWVGALRKHRPVVIYELDYRFGPQVNLTIPWMKSKGYDCAVPVPGKGPGTHCSVCNVLCMPEASMWETKRPPRPKQKETRGISTSKAAKHAEA